MLAINQGQLDLNGSISQDLLIEISGQLSGNATVERDIHNHGIISPGQREFNEQSFNTRRKREDTEANVPEPSR